MCVTSDTMDDQLDKKEKVTTSSRRSNKPLMEKRRRQRINECLNQLKGLVLQAMNKDSTQYSKLEKADILEMTVKHLKLIQRQQMSAAMATDPNVISKYRAGFNECAAEISRYLDSVNQSNPELKNRIMNYLANSMMQFPVIPVYQAMTSPYQFQVAPQVPAHHGSMPPQFYQDTVPISAKPSYMQREEEKHFTQASPEVPRYDALRIPVSSDVTSRASTSPQRQVPSPCDSDSGLSDSSLTLSHDENGNYSQFNINHPRTSQVIKTESGGRVLPMEFRNEVDYSQVDRRPNTQKRSSDFPGVSSPPKRQRTPENTYKSEHSNVARQPPVSENMWRPW